MLFAVLFVVAVTSVVSGCCMLNFALLNIIILPSRK